ncbi:MAG: hypothetical protein HYS09_08190 [Chloroflexi bacterium]|nr:hypothetical protein [Chloroflexota bacterium]
MSELERQVSPRWHIPDAVRVGVLAGTDDDGLWLQGHFMSCEGCRSPLTRLLMKKQVVAISRPAQVSCPVARSDMFRYLESGQEPSEEAFAHIVSCDLCDDLFFEPAQAVVLLEHDPDEVGEAG